MYVTLNFGNRAGQTVDMPFMDAKALIEAGRAVRSDGSNVKAPKPVVTVVRIPVPANWRVMPYFSKLKLAREITKQRDFSGSDEVNAAIEKYLGGSSAL